jgi:Mrp family chromosome partitioning ATPase
VDEADAAVDDFVVVAPHGCVHQVKYRAAQFGKRRVVLYVRLGGVAQFNAPKHATRIAGAKSRPRPGIVNERVFDRTNFADRIVQTPWRGVEFLRLLPAGGYDRQMLERLRDVIADTADEFDLIVIDDGLSSTESILLGSPRFLDNVIMVVESGHTRRDQLQEGLEALKQSRAKLTGAVLAA